MTMELEITPEMRRRMEFGSLMDRMPSSWRRRWCFFPWYGGCACLGCPNVAGRAQEKGFTYEDWRNWMGGERRNIPTFAWMVTAHQRIYDAFPQSIKDKCPLSEERPSNSVNATQK